MAKYTTNYVITVLLTIIAACMGSLIVQEQPHVDFDARLEALPLTIGDWHGRDIELDAGVRDALSADRILSRYYANVRTGSQVSLLIVYRKYGRRGFAHRPELCYPAAGWEIVSAAYTSVPYCGREVRARCVIARREGSRAAVTYWFASGRRTEANYVRQQVQMALDRLQRQKYGWAFIRADVPASHGREEALAQTRAFVMDIDEPLNRILTGSD